MLALRVLHGCVDILLRSVNSRAPLTQLAGAKVKDREQKYVIEPNPFL